MSDWKRHWNIEDHFWNTMQINTVVYRESVYFSALDRFLSTRSVITLQVRISIYLNHLTLDHRIYVLYYTILSESLSTLIRLLKTVEVKILAKIGRREAVRNCYSRQLLSPLIKISLLDVQLLCTYLFTVQVHWMGTNRFRALFGVGGKSALSRYTTVIVVEFLWGQKWKNYRQNSSGCNKVVTYLMVEVFVASLDEEVADDRRAPNLSKAAFSSRRLLALWSSNVFSEVWCCFSPTVENTSSSLEVMAEPSPEDLPLLPP